MAPSFLDVVVYFPAVAALIIQALCEADRKALRAAHTSLLAAVAREITTLTTEGHGHYSLTRKEYDDKVLLPLRWPALFQLSLNGPAYVLRPTGDQDQVWEKLEVLKVVMGQRSYLDFCALAAAAPRMPKLRILCLDSQYRDVAYYPRDFPADSHGVVEVLFGETLWSSLEELSLSLHEDFLPAVKESVGVALEKVWRNIPRLRSLRIMGDTCEDEEDTDTPAALALAGWRLEVLNMSFLCHSQVAALVAAPTFALQELCIEDGSKLTPAAVRALASASWPLKKIKITCQTYFHELESPGLALAALSQHAKLQEVYLGFCRVDVAALRAFFDATWSSLIKLTIYDEEDFGDLQCDVATFAGLPMLEVLHLGLGVTLGIAGVRSLANCCLRLRNLTLVGVHLGLEGAEALARAAWPLEHLELYDCSLGAEALATGNWLYLKHLALRDMTENIGLDDVNALVASACFARLLTLDLSNNAIGDDATAALAAGAWLALEELRLSNSKIGLSGARALAARPWVSLNHLDLSYNELGDAGLAELALGKWSALTRLDLGRCSMSSRPTLETVRRWAPALMKIDAYQ